MSPLSGVLPTRRRPGEVATCSATHQLGRDYFSCVIYGILDVPRGGAGRRHPPLRPSATTYRRHCRRLRLDHGQPGSGALPRYLGSFTGADDSWCCSWRPGTLAADSRPEGRGDSRARLRERHRAYRARASPVTPGEGVRRSGQASGTGERRIIVGHIIPTPGPDLVDATLLVAVAILTKAALSFLGFGVGRPVPRSASSSPSARRFDHQRPWLVTPRPSSSS